MGLDYKAGADDDILDDVTIGPEGQVISPILDTDEVNDDPEELLETLLDREGSETDD